ncbi:glycoside hydrolase family 95 protein [Anaerophaga thermohalophila]|uniref:glycoside hydrolase family 95 protein n=1 Tax=Anaerophaga thermohalophila TaxID=177400 RepID=UPI00031316D9|nr:glycoside hydrolase family 95 protein [Anaerophaga thermohalophila]
MKIQPRKIKKTIILSVLLSFISLAAMHAEEPLSKLTLWYNEPAEQWEEALPIGNGRLGAMIFGSVAQEKLQLNEESIWTKKDEYADKPDGYKHIKKIRRLLFDEQYKEAEKLVRKHLLSQRMPGGTNTYQTLGELTLSFEGHQDFSNYHRELDIEKAVAKVSYHSDGVKYTREYFSSHPANATIIKLSADKPGKISFTAHLNRPGEGEKIRAKDNMLVMHQKVDNQEGVTYETRVRISASGGTTQIDGNTIKIEDADEVILTQVAATNYHGESPINMCRKTLSDLEEKDYKALKTEHISDYQSLFNRVSLDIGSSDACYFPTDERLKALRNGSEDPALFSLYFQFGRYLLISSSRAGTMPANLQGIWAKSLTPPWNADYHLNINSQMNYWPAEVTNLSECHLPYLYFIGELRENGRKTAKKLYGAEGFTAHHGTDAWHYTTAQGHPQWAMWPMGAAWAATHIWKHFEFTRDTAFLDNYGYDVMQEAALFLSDFLVEDPETGMLVSGPSISPENTFITPEGNKAFVVMGPSMDHQIIHHLFGCVIDAAEVLNINSRFIHKIKRQLNQLTPPEIGDDGRILEWATELKEAEPGHRHMSHLYGLFPSDQFSWQETPELMKAAARVIEERLRYGGGHTGWSRAWMVNFYARLKDSNNAYQNMRALLTKSTHPNLFDNHPPFQIDGNFGGTSGMTEMLLQSHQDYIELLPSLPEEWDTGSVTGLKARGGHTVDIFWENGILTKAVITSPVDTKIQMVYNNKSTHINLKKGKPGTIISGDFVKAQKLNRQ